MLVLKALASQGRMFIDRYWLIFSRMAAECDETDANLYCVDHSLTGSETRIEAGCHEITKLLEEWRDGDESTLKN